MKEKSIFQTFTNWYQLSKTLRFSLKPVGETKNLIRKLKEEKDFDNPLTSLIHEDEKKAAVYKEVKKAIDNLHRDFLSFSLDEKKFSEETQEKLKENIKKFYKFYEVKKSEKDSKNKNDEKITEIQKDLAEILKNILDENAPKFLQEKFTKQKNFLDKVIHKKEEEKNEAENHKKELVEQIKQIPKEKVKEKENLQNQKEAKEKELKNAEREVRELKKCKNCKFTEAKFLYNKTENLFPLLRLYFIQEEDTTKSIKKFDGFHTYFTGFNETRENIYDIKGQGEKDKWSFKSTSIAYRLFEQNIKFHFDNILKWQELQKYLTKENTKNKLSEKKWDWDDKIKKTEEKLNFKIEDFLEPENFYQFFSQDGIDKYNLIIGGQKAKEGQEKIQGINEIINLTRQQIDGDRRKFPPLQEFYKQILSEKDAFIETITDDKDLIEEINRFIEKEEDFIEDLTTENKKGGKLSFKELLEEGKNNLENIYISKEILRVFSQDLVARWEGLETWYLNDFGDKEKKAQAKRRVYTFGELQENLDKKREWVDEKEKNTQEGNFYEQLISKADKKNRPWLKDLKEENFLFSYLENKFNYLLQERNVKLDDLKKSNILKDYLQENFKINKEQKDKVKKYLDASKDLYRFLRSLNVKEKDFTGDDKNKEQEQNWKETILRFINPDKNNITKLYNKARNFLTKKEFSEEKFKLNFENPTLSKGWDRNKEVENTCVILMKDDKYFLGIMNKKHNKIFDESIQDLKKSISEKEEQLNKKKSEFKKKEKGTKIYEELQNEITDLKSELNSVAYEKMNYFFFKDGTTMIPKCSTQLIKVKKHFKNNVGDFVLKENSKKDKFDPSLKISKEVFELNNKVYDRKSKEFVDIKKDDKRPKKFQKAYLEIKRKEISIEKQNDLEKQIKNNGDNLNKNKIKKKVKELLETKEVKKEIQDSLELYQKEYKKALNTWISFCKDFLESYPSTRNAPYEYEDKEGKNIFEKDYKSLDEFYRQLSGCIYKIETEYISENYINKMLKEQRLYLFEIYSKDFSTDKKKKGTDNLHTLYWKALFEKENLGDVVIKLNGKAELFYRKASLKKPFKHKEREALKHKFYSEEWKELGLEIKSQSTKKEELENHKDFHKNLKIDNNRVIYKGKIIGRIVEEKKEITKDKRYSEDKILFHCPITLNFKAKGREYLNESINQFLKDNHEKINIIGIDRGEKNLLYYSVINQEGKILEQDSFNQIDSNFKPSGSNETKKIDYHKKLNEKEKDRAGARENWETIENIKELKSGYLSQVVHQLCDLIIKHNAIVVLENLNAGFKRGRFKFEKQIYQKFEIALIHKLNYLVNKQEKYFNKTGHYLKAYQLTNKFKTFSEIGNQSGILFYTAAGYTSKTDPITGYMRSLYPKYKDVKQAQTFFSKFRSIKYNGKHFEFTYNLKNLKGMTGSYDDKKELDEDKINRNWTIHSHVERTQYKERKLSKEEREQEEYKEATNGKWRENVDAKVNEKLIDLFKKELEKLKTDNLEIKCYKDFICDSSKQKQFGESKFLAKLLAYFNRLLDMRVFTGDKNSKDDFIFSPVEPFFDSRKVKSKDNQNLPLPKDSDANGAYNIARKGIMILERIKDKKPNLSITKTDWQNFCQKEEIVKKQKEKWKEIVNK